MHFGFSLLLNDANVHFPELVSSACSPVAADLTMTRIYRYSKYHYLGILAFGFPAFLLVKGFLYEAFAAESYASSIIFSMLALFIVAGFVQWWRYIAIKIITDSDSIIISKPFKSVCYRWEEVSEFGKVRRVAPYVGGYWVYYIIGGSQNKKTLIGVKGLKNLEDLVPYILYKAYKAKIVNIQKAENISN